jgi:hypothetical protein
MPAEWEDEPDIFEMVAAACGKLELRLDRLEAELGPASPAPLGRKDNTNVPVQGGWQSPVDPTD